jgi:uncharacterized membrane protein AbrB (regulator of aidB expression)
MPVAYLIGGMLAGIAIALARPGRVKLPSWSYAFAQALLGVAIGSIARTGIAGSPPLFAALPLVVVATIGLSLAAAFVLAPTTKGSTPTLAWWRCSSTFAWCWLR